MRKPVTLPLWQFVVTIYALCLASAIGVHLAVDWWAAR